MATAHCKYDGCSESIFCRNFCSTHYREWRREQKTSGVYRPYMKPADSQKRPSWEYLGDEASLLKEQEKQNG
jgi:hypothetical protein